MSTKAGTIQGTQTGVSGSGAWIAAILLTALIAVALFAMLNSKATSSTVPATAKVESTRPVGFSHVAPTTTRPVGFSHVAPATAKPVTDTRPLVTSPDYVCHQCL